MSVRLVVDVFSDVRRLSTRLVSAHVLILYSTSVRINVSVLRKTRNVTKTQTIRGNIPYLQIPVFILLRVIHKEIVMQMSPKNFAPKSTSISHCVVSKS